MASSSRSYQHPPLHPFPSSLGLNIFGALKPKKKKKGKKENVQDIAFIDSDNIEVHIVKYMPSSFDIDFLFMLHHLSLGVLNTCNWSMDGMEKMCDGYPGAPPRPPISKMILGFLLALYLCRPLLVP